MKKLKCLGTYRMLVYRIHAASLQFSVNKNTERKQTCTTTFIAFFLCFIYELRLNTIQNVLK